MLNISTFSLYPVVFDGKKEHIQLILTETVGVIVFPMRMYENKSTTRYFEFNPFVIELLQQNVVV